MKNIKPTELKNVLGTFYKTKTPLFIYGGFGIGKSAIVKAKAKEIAKEKKKEFVDWNNTDKETKLEVGKTPEKYFVLVDIRLSQYEPTDLKGLPKFDNGDKYIEWKIPLWLNHFTNEKADGILFFDEMNLASPSVLASCYQILHDKVADENKLSKDLFIVGCGNRLCDKAHTFDLPEPLRDRIGEFELVIDNDEWFDWAIENGINTDIISFLRFREDYLLKVAKDREDKSITPRGWERTSTLLKSTPEKDVKLVVSGSIGEGVASEFVAFVKLQTKFDLNDVLKNPQKVKNIREIDLRYSLISGLSKKFESKKEILEPLLHVCENLSAEYGVLLLKLVKGINPSYVEKNVVKTEIWKKRLSKEYGKYVGGN